MATKTFEELKQMAIQIRDEKTNKQNTATRIGTQMLEHLNKLEQDFLDKDTTEGKFSELESMPFSNNMLFNSIVKELYISDEQLISNIQTCIIYNGYSGFYGIRLASKDSTTIIDIRNSETKDLIIGPKGGVLLDVSNMIEDHIQFDIQIYSRAGNIDYSPSLKSQIIKDNLSILQKNSVLMPFTDNQEVNMFLKEILIPISDDLVKSITKIRVHNVSNITNKYYIGISLYNSTNNVVGECRFSYDTEEEAINNRKNILDNGYGRYILVDWNNIPYGKYTDYECNMFRINNIDFSPSIYNYINSSILNKVQSFGFTNNKTVNSFLKEIYIPISDAILVTVDRIRIHNISNLSDKYYIGFVLYSASANVADCLFVSIQ